MKKQMAKGIFILLFLFLLCLWGCDLTPPVLTGITVLPETMTLSVGDSQTITSITASYSDGSTDSIILASCTYISDDTAVATVTDGIITAVDNGSTTVKISYTEGGITQSDTIAITVTEVIGCIDFESLPLGKVYHVGDTFTDSGATITVLLFQWGNASWTSGGYARVVDQNLAGHSGMEVNTNNVNLGFKFSSTLKGLSINFGEYGGNLNIQINDEFKNFQDFDDINGTTIGGVSVSVTDGDGNNKGRLILSGEMDTFNFQEEKFTFLIGGQELWIDHVCPLE